MASEHPGSDNADRHVAKVVGLGAPTSMWIYFESAEIPALLDAIDDEIGRFRAPLLSDNHGRAETSDQLDELRRMRFDVERAAAARRAGGFDVVWPTVLAYGVVHGAPRHAQRRADSVIPGDGAEGAAARTAVSAALRSRRDFDAVDTGGLEEVWL